MFAGCLSADGVSVCWIVAFGGVCQGVGRWLVGLIVAFSWAVLLFCGLSVAFILECHSDGFWGDLGRSRVIFGLGYVFVFIVRLWRSCWLWCGLV